MNRVIGEPVIVLAVTVEESLRLLDGLPEYLSEQGWDVRLVSSAVNPAVSRGLRHYRIVMARNPSLLRDIGSLCEWIQLLRRLRPQVVMAGTPKAGMLGMVAAFVVRVPVRIYVLRGLRLESERGAKRSALAALERITSSMSTKVLAVSPSLRREYARMNLAPRKKITVLGPGSSNGVAVQVPVTRRPRPTRGRLVIGFVGRLNPDKGLRTLLEAFALIRQRGVEASLLLVGPEDPEGYLRDCLSGLPIPQGDLEWVGRVGDVAPHYEKMDVLCLPTLREGFPNVVLEAAMYSIPTVASAVTGCVDAVVDGTTGLLFEAGNGNDLADKLAGLTRNPKAMLEMGSAARERAVRDFARPVVWKRTERFLAENLDKASQNGSRRAIPGAGKLLGGTRHHTPTARRQVWDHDAKL